EAVAPLSARQALRFRTEPTAGEGDGRWQALEQVLERRFFDQAREIKASLCDRRLGKLIESARAGLASQRQQALDSAATLAESWQCLDGYREHFRSHVTTQLRADINAETAQLLRTAAGEILELVRPRRSP